MAIPISSLITGAGFAFSWRRYCFQHEFMEGEMAERIEKITFFDETAIQSTLKDLQTLPDKVTDVFDITSRRNFVRKRIALTELATLNMLYLIPVLGKLEHKERKQLEGVLQGFSGTLFFNRDGVEIRSRAEVHKIHHVLRIWTMEENRKGRLAVLEPIKLLPPNTHVSP